MEAVELYLNLEGVYGVAQDARAIHKSRKAAAELPPEGAPQRNVFLVDIPDKNLEWSSGFTTECYCGKRFFRKVVDEGTFFCPFCQERKHYKHKEISLHCHYCWVVKLCLARTFDDYVKCAGCANHFQVDILDWDHSKAKRALDFAILRVMIRVAMATGVNEEAQLVDKVRKGYTSLTGKMIETDLILDLTRYCVAYGSIETDLVQFVPFLSKWYKDVILKAMVFVSLTDGDLEREEAELLVEAGRVLEMTKADFKEVVHNEYNMRKRPAANTPDTAFLRAMIRIAMIKDRNEEATKLLVNNIHNIYQSMTSKTTTNEDILLHMMECGSYGSIESDLAEIAPHLVMDQKDMIIKAMILVSSADRDVKKKEAALLTQAGHVLNMTNSHIKDLLHDEYRRQRDLHLEQKDMIVEAMLLLSLETGD